MSCSGRALCRWLGIHRSTLRYRPKPKPDRKEKLEAEIVRMSQAHPTLGYKKIAGKLREHEMPPIFGPVVSYFELSSLASN